MKRSFVKNVIASSMIVAMISGSVIMCNTPKMVEAVTILDGDYTANMGRDILINKEANTEFEIPINISSIPDETIKGIEILVDIPRAFNVVGVSANDNILNSKDIDYYFDEDGERKLRIALADMSTGSLKINKLAGEQCITKIKLKVVNDLPVGSESTIKIERLTFRCDEDKDAQYDVKNSGVKIQTAGEGLTINVRELYVGDGDDLIPGGNKAVAVEFSNVPEKVGGFNFKDYKSILYYSPELSEKNNIATYVGMMNWYSLNELKDWNNYEPIYSDKTIRFGDDKGDGIDAQDALIVLSKWLRKSPIYSEDSKITFEQNILQTNVNADGAINTRDAMEIVDNYVSKKEFSILSK